MNLQEQRLDIIAEHQAMEKYHPHWKVEAAAGKRISERPIGFLCDDEVVIVSKCVCKILNGLKQFVDAMEPIFADPERARARWNFEHHAFIKAKKLLQQHTTHPAELRVHQQVWNSVVHAMSEVGMEVVTTDGMQDVTPAANQSQPRESADV